MLLLFGLVDQIPVNPAAILLDKKTSKIRERSKKRPKFKRWHETGTRTLNSEHSELSRGPLSERDNTEKNFDSSWPIGNQLRDFAGREV